MPQGHIHSVVCILVVLACSYAAVQSLGQSEGWTIFILCAFTSFVTAAMWVNDRLFRARFARRLTIAKREATSAGLKLGDRTEEAELFSKVSELIEAFTKTHDLESVLHQTAEITRHILGVEEVVAQVCIDDENKSIMRAEAGAENIKLCDNMVIDVLEKGMSRLLNNLSAYERYSEMADNGYTSMLVAPLGRSHQPVGLLGALSTSGRHFSGKELRILSTFSMQASLIIENARLYDHVEKMSDRMKTELELAQTVQMNLIPDKEPEIPGYDMKGFYQPATELGGDYWDFIQLDDHRFALVIADVSGHGVPAALLMTMFRMILRNEAGRFQSPSETIKVMNSTIYNDIERGSFITTCYCVLDTSRNTMTIVNAGHPKSIFVRNGHDRLEFVKPDGIAVGFDEGPLFESTLEETEQQFKPGDAMLLYTDGIMESFNNHDKEYGIERLSKSFLKSSPQSSKDIIEALRVDLKRFTGDAEQRDDIAMIVLKRKH